MTSAEHTARSAVHASPRPKFNIHPLRAASQRKIQLAAPALALGCRLFPAAAFCRPHAAAEYARPAIPTAMPTIKINSIQFMMKTPFAQVEHELSSPIAT
jgi:hypothetical protein